MVKKSLLSTQMKQPGKAQLDMLSTTRDKLGDRDKRHLWYLSEIQRQKHCLQLQRALRITVENMEQ